MRAWLALCLMAALGALLAWWGADPHSLDWQPTQLAAQPWRLLTAAWVHGHPLHLAANLAALGLLALAGWRVPVTTRDALALALAWPLTHALLLMVPSLAHYGGLSGWLHAAVAIVALRLVALGQRMGWLWLAALALKLALESPWGEAARTLPGWPMPVVPAAHALGALAGALAWFGVCAVRSRLHV